MAMGAGIMDFVHRFQALQNHRDTGNDLIKDLLLYTEHVESKLRDENTRLAQDLRDTRLDLTDAIRSRRDMQQELEQTKNTIFTITQINDALKNRNPYVMVFIDGDGCIFKPALIRQGIEGGKRAAYGLRHAVAEHVGDDEVEVVAKIIANLSGLGKAMKRDGSIDSDGELRDFMLGFTQAKASFDFIDCGHGKERADTKIKESTRWHLRNHNCKQILLGVSHDAGYAPFLDEHLRDEAERRRLTVIEAFPTVREIENTGVGILNLTGQLFREEKLVDRTITPPAPAAASLTSAVSVTASPVASSTSYATVMGGASPPPQMSFPLAPKSTNTPVSIRLKPAHPAWSPGPRGLDPPIQINLPALEAIKKRKDSSKLCNNHFLRGPCAKGDDCCFEHKYKPSQDEIRAIAHLARLNPCTNGQDCDVENCIYGHHCPSVKDGWCTHPFCKFRADEHPPGTKFKSAKNYEH